MYIIKLMMVSIFIIMLHCYSAAQDYRVKGHIYDLQSNQPIAGAIIESNDAAFKTISQTSGYFEISTLHKNGSLKISMLGFKTIEVNYNDQKRELNVQMEQDAFALNEFRVTAYAGNRTNKQTAGSIASVSHEQIMQGNGVSLQPALNAVAGVRMDQSTLSDSRISIRGMGVRSPWGIRNIKIYINDIPLTEADGTTRIEGIDVSNIGKAEIIKGPASSIYGGGTGGVINFQLERSPYQTQSIELSSLAGSFGLQRIAATYRNGGEKVNSYISYGLQEFDGYRVHSADERKFLTANFQVYPTDRQTITVLVNRTSQRSQIPGALTEEQVMDNGKQANPSNLEKNAGRNQTWTRIGIGNGYRFNERFSNSTSIFTYFYDLDHPLPFAYIRNFYQSFGGRTRFDFDPGFAILPTKFTIGAEVNQGMTKGTQYVNDHGTPGTINGNTDYKNTFYSIFAQSESYLFKKTKLALGLSFNGLTYEVQDLLQPAQSGKKTFDLQASPRIALSHDFGSFLSLHASINSGYSPPSTSEIRTEEGSINRFLQSEKGTNFEINAKGNLLKSRLAYDVAVFDMEMNGELIGQAVQQGITVYRNSGKTSHKGVELALVYKAVKPEDGKFVTQFRPFAALTYSDFKFVDYKILGSDNEIKAVYDGNQLTGIAPWQINAGFNLSTKSGFHFNCNYFYSDPLPLNDANSAYNAAYALVNLKLSYSLTVARHYGIDVYAGADNVTNSHYSSFVALNAVGFDGAKPAYFNPSLPRNFFGGLNLKYVFK